MFSASSSNYSWRKSIGVVLLLIELITASSTIYGFSAFFIVLSKYGIYDKYCTSSVTINSTTTTTHILCEKQTKQYENAATLGIVLFDVSSVFAGILTDSLGPRFVKLIAMVLHVVGWLALALIQPGRDYLLYIHTTCTSLSGTMIAITAYASCGYFSKSRATMSSLFVGANIAAAVWYSFFEILIHTGRITLAQISYIWMSLGFLMCITAFLNLDWRFSLFNLPYQFDTTLEQSMSDRRVSLHVTTTIETTKSKWYENIYQRKAIWEHLTSPLYILIVLFLSILFVPINLLSITWYPWVYHISNKNTLLANKYTFTFNMLTLGSLVICPLNGFLLELGADRSKAQQLLNILISQSVTWLLNIISCILCMFTTTSVIIPVMIVNNIARATVEAGSQAALATFFPSKYIGTLSGFMFTIGGIISLIQYGLVDLTQDVPMSWRAWLILLMLIVLISAHLVQLWSKYTEEKKKLVSNTHKSKLEIFKGDKPII